MILSVNKIIGSAVYRTREILNKDQSFIDGLSKYNYTDVNFANDCLFDDKFHLWYYPGTPEEISTILNQLNKITEGQKLKFPAIFNYNTFKQTKTDKGTIVSLNLAIVARTFTEWTTGERDNKVFDTVLRPVYEALVKSLKRPYIRWADGFINPTHDYYEVFTTGQNKEVVENQYTDHLDAIELHNLRLVISEGDCERYKEEIEREYNLVLEDLNNLIQ